MTFGKKALDDMAQTRAGLTAEIIALQLKFLRRTYSTDRAKEFAHHGFARRLLTLKRCVENVFKVLPPEQTAIPTSETRKDAEINIQAFLFNAFGALENLAWIWVEEKGLTKANGKPLSNFDIGLRDKNEIVRNSFSPAFQQRLVQFDAWFEHFDGFRNSLAHRIPLYIPPYIVRPADAEAYKELEQQKQAALAALDLNKHKELDSAQEKLAFFRAYMQRSPVEEPRPVVFHAQLLADFATIKEIAEGVLNELDALAKQRVATGNV